MIETLNDLFAPDGIETFLGDAFGRHALLVEGASDKFDGLFSWSDLNRMLVYGGLGHPRLRVIKGNDEVPAGCYSRIGRNGHTRLLVGELSSCLRDGAMLAIQSVELLSEAVSKFCRLVESALHVPVQIDLYAAWPETSHREPMWNDHDSLVIQLEGTKRWRLHLPTTNYPASNCNPPAPDGEPRWTGSTARGQLLYIPRGWWFEDSTPGGPSLYLVATFRSPRGVDMVWRILERAAETERLRMDIPRFGSIEAQIRYLTYVQAEVAELCARPGLHLGLLEHVQDMSEPLTDFNLPWSAADVPVPPALDCKVVPLVRFPRASAIVRRPRVDGIEIKHNGHNLMFNESTARLLERIFLAPGMTVRGLIEEFGEEMTEAEVLDGLAGLIRHGLATLRLRDAKY